MGKNILLVVAALVVCAFSSCRHDVYRASQVNMLRLKEKGDWNASLGFSDIQASYAVSNHIAVSVNGAYAVNNDKATHFFDLGPSYTEMSAITRYKWEGALSYYFASPHQDFNYYIMAGYGNENQYYKNSIDTSGKGSYKYNLTAHCVNWFIQPGIMYGDKNVGLGLAFRLNYYQFASWTPGENTIADFKAKYGDAGAGTTLPLVEPALAFYVGGKAFRFYSQVVISRQQSNQNIGYMPIAFFAGIRYDFLQELHRKYKVLE